MRLCNGSRRYIVVLGLSLLLLLWTTATVSNVVAPPETVVPHGGSTGTLRTLEGIATATQLGTVSAAVTDTAATLRSDRFMTFNALPPWYGLTNQLMCYAAALRYGMDDNRTVLFPAHRDAADVLPFYELMDADATQQALGNVVAIALPTDDDRSLGYQRRPQPSAPWGPRNVPPDLYPPASMNKRKLWLPERTEFRLRSAARLAVSRRYMVEKVYRRSKELRFIRHHNLFMRFAWPPREHWNECRLMATIQPAGDVIAFAASLGHALTAGGRVRYVAVHLRLEPDGLLLRPSAARGTSPDQFRAFLRERAVPFALAANASVVYLCIGRLDDSHADVVEMFNRDNPGVTVTYRARLLKSAPAMPAIRTFAGTQRAVHTRKGGHRTQDHYMSFVELLLLSRAAASVVTEFSSLKFSVFSRRCFNGVAAKDAERAVHTLSIRDDGSLTAPFRTFQCSGASELGWCGHVDWAEGG
jgi:hypothetical protein